MSIAIFGSVLGAILAPLIRLRAEASWTLCGRRHLGYGGFPQHARWTMKLAHSYCGEICMNLLSPLWKSARQTDLISSEDRALLKGLLSAIEREGFPAQKAGNRGIQSAKSLTFAAVAIVAGLYWSGIESEFANHSVICKKAGAFLGETEAQALRVIEDAPADIRHAISSLLDELRHGHGGSTALDTGHSAIVERRNPRNDGL
jgi:hypothetical protein